MAQGSLRGREPRRALCFAFRPVRSEARGSALASQRRRSRASGIFGAPARGSRLERFLRGAYPRGRHGRACGAAARFRRLPSSAPGSAHGARGAAPGAVRGVSRGTAAGDPAQGVPSPQPAHHPGLHASRARARLSRCCASSRGSRARGGMRRTMRRSGCRFMSVSPARWRTWIARRRESMSCPHEVLNGQPIEVERMALLAIAARARLRTCL